MKFIKNHLMFILPLMTILLGVEFYLVFDRTTDTYEKGLREGYSMLVVTHEPASLETLQSLNAHISSSEKIKRDTIVSSIAKGVSKDAEKEIVDALPHFYTVQLDTYLDVSELNKIKEDLESHANVKRVETFGYTYGSTYRLFDFIIVVIIIYIEFMAVVSVFLIFKQTEI